MTNGIPAEVIQFITSHIDSLEQLEVLLFLYEHRERSWTSGQINDVIKSSAQSVTDRLAKLAGHGLLARTEEAEARYQFNSRHPEFETQVRGLAEAYKERRLKVIEAIFAKPSDSIRSFADAFKFLKDKDKPNG